MGPTKIERISLDTVAEAPFVLDVEFARARQTKQNWEEEVPKGKGQGYAAGLRYAISLL